MIPITREDLGKVVRQAWVDYVVETGTENEHSTVPWEELDEWSKQVDRYIGTAVALHVVLHILTPLERAQISTWLDSLQDQAVSIMEPSSL